MKNFDFYIQHVEDLSIHFSYDGEFEIHGDSTLHIKDFEVAFSGYKAMREIFEISDKVKAESCPRCGQSPCTWGPGCNY